MMIQNLFGVKYQRQKNVKDIDKKIRDISENINWMLPVVDCMDKSIDKHKISKEI